MPGRYALGLALELGAGPAFAQEGAPSIRPRLRSMRGRHRAVAEAAHFDIRAFQVKGNTVLPADAVERAVYPFMGPGRSEADVERAREALQRASRRRAMSPSQSSYPSSAVESGILQLEVQQQAIGKVLVEGAQKSRRHPRRSAFVASRPDAALAFVPARCGRTRPETVAPRNTSSWSPAKRRGRWTGCSRSRKTSLFHASAELNNFHSAATSDSARVGARCASTICGAGATVCRCRRRRRRGGPMTAPSFPPTT